MGEALEMFYNIPQQAEGERFIKVIFSDNISAMVLAPNVLFS